MKILLFAIFGILLAAMAPTSSTDILEKNQLVSTNLTIDHTTDPVYDDIGCRMSCCIEAQGVMICSTRGGLFSSCERAFANACADLDDLF